MSRKTLLILAAVILVACAAIFYFLFGRQPEGVGEAPAAGGTPCLVFQGTDPGKPCFLQGYPTSGGPVTATSSPQATSTSTPSVVQAQTPVDVACGKAPNAFEKNDCISSLAQEKNDKTVCDYVTGYLAQEACKRDVQNPPSTVSAPPASPYQAFVQQYFSTKPSATASQGTVIEPSSAAPKPPASLEDKVKYSLSYGAPLAVYAASRYQVAPGDSIKIYGSGFTSSGNVLNIGAVETTLGSADGSTLETTAPGTTGEYEIWVTNQKGSSRVSTRPVKIVITNSPAPSPVIDKATPSVVPVDGTVVLSGSGFSPSNNVLTSLGILMGVPSDGHTISFAISSLPYTAQAKAAPALKGKISPVFVTIQASASASEKIFQFNVQF